MDSIFENAVKRGAQVVSNPKVIKDEHGSVKLATIKTYGDTTHTFVERSRYHGAFMPGFRAAENKDPLSASLPPVPIDVIDHCVGNQDWGEMEAACD